MFIRDIHHKVEKAGPSCSLFPTGDYHFLLDKGVDVNEYQPLNISDWRYLKYCLDDVRAHSHTFGKKIYTAILGDISEVERSSVRKLTRTLRKNDRRAQDVIHKHILRESVIPRLARLLRGTTLIGGVAGNHLLEFYDTTDGRNSDEMVIKKLGGTYFGECKALLNFHFSGKDGQAVLKRVLILHGNRGGSKSVLISELQKIHAQYGKIDCIIRAHSHDPMTAFYCRYDLPEKEGRPMKKHECLVVCIGSTRDGEKTGSDEGGGYDDYSERFNYQPVPGRFPIVIFNATYDTENNGNLSIRLRPYTL